MILGLGDILDQQRLDRIGAALSGAQFADGTATAGWHARVVKKNRQAMREARTNEAAALVQQALEQSDVFRSGVLPKRFVLPLFARYEPGMTYGSHVDDALMAASEGRLRTDVAATVFLSPPASYEGGELVIEETAGERIFKLPAGSAVVYPATTLHRVAPVARGVRLVAVTWIESFVRDAAQREMLFDLDQARRAIFAEKGKSREFDLVSKTYSNLLRRWAET
jgi:PKHD-type hydroxylase